ncbi:hypothetical protein C8F01DRAFT_1366564 [Mycena amicta]|nr:hypothetical protein C8F01DRAFT_1366564 [Mycena amicta]
MSVTETRLPLELEREIFQYTAELYPNAIPRLLCVAHRVLVWIEPIAYHTIKVNSSRRFLAFLAATKSKSPEFFARHARRILIDESFDGPLEDVCAAPALCTKVTRLAGAGDFLGHLLLPVIIPMRLERIALSLSDIFPTAGGRDLSAVDLSLPCFQTLTHLDISESVSDEHDAMVYATKLCALPVLTHLSLTDLVSWEAVQKLLQGCRCLEVFVVQWSESDGRGRQRAGQAPFDDMRFLVTKYQPYKEAIGNPPNYWTRAEGFIADKRKGKVHPRCFWMTRGNVPGIIIG